MKKLIYMVLLLTILMGNVYGFHEGLVEEGEEYYIETAGSTGVPNLNAKAAILYDATYDRVLYEKNSREKRANASTTKMITALVAYENGNLDDVVEVSVKAANTGGSTINLRKGDKITLNDLIKGLLVHSGNDAAVAIAEHISGSVENFAILMNDMAETVGAVDTNFVTPHGLDAENHHSTAYDLMIISKEILNTPYLANIVAQKTVEITVNGYTKTLNTTNEMLSFYEGANGIKTGFTGDAGRCLVTSSKRDGRQLISVVLGCDTKKNRTTDSVKLLDYGFKSFELVELSQYVKDNICIMVEKSQGGIYSLSKNIDLKYPLKAKEKESLVVKYNIKSGLVAPLPKGEIIAITEIMLNGTTIAKINYSLPENINRKTWKEYFKEIFLGSLEESYIN